MKDCVKTTNIEASSCWVCHVIVVNSPNRKHMTKGVHVKYKRGMVVKLLEPKRSSSVRVE